MKPLLLKFAAFGPYVDEQVIDFGQLSKSGLFLIHGETGSGKTVILDAVTYALYGESSGGIRGNITSMRCQLAREDKETYVEFTFEINSQIYTFARGLRTVHKRSGEIEFNPTQTILVHDKNGDKQPMFENPKAAAVRAEAQRLIGLDYEQFRQIIILPQGQFEKLLIAESGDKEQILSTLFAAQKWDKISEYISAESRKAKAELSELKMQISHILEENECEDAEQLELLCDKIDEEADLLNKEKHQCEKEFENAVSEYDKTKTSFDLYTQHKKLTDELCELESRADDISEKELILKKYDSALKIKSEYDSYIGSEKICTQRQKSLERADNDLKNAQSEFDTAEKNLNDILLKENDILSFEKQLVSLENMRQIYENIDTSRADAERLKSEYEKQRNNFEKAEEKYKKSEKKRAELEQNQALLYEEYIALFHSSGIAGMLASELEDGQPCPVCGSCLHPKKAQYNGDFSSATLTDKQNEIDIAAEKLKQARQDFEKNTISLNDAKEKAEICDNNYRRAAAQYEALLSNASDEFDSLESLCKAIDGICAEINEYKERKDSAKTALDNARSSLSASKAVYSNAGAEYANARAELEKAETTFDKALKKADFLSISEFCECILNDDDAAVIKDDVNTYKENTAALRKNLSSMSDIPNERPDIESAQSLRDETQKSLTDVSGKSAVAHEEKKRRHEQYKKLLKLEEKLKKHSLEYDKLSFFADSIAGNKGISLKRYILGITLSSVTEQANRMLANVHGGRYRLYRKDDSNSKAKKLGLGLEVYDSYSGKRRDVATLSGGEKFLVSLALSIGLSAMAQTQAGGIRTEAMFIDEGFGTLDSASVADALDILAGLRNGNSIIGIISHIPALRESIPSCIEVKKGRLGSNIKVCV